MSLINTLTRGLIYRDGENSVARYRGSWSKSKNSHYWVSNRLYSLIGVYIPFFPIWILSLFRVIWAMKLIGRVLGYSGCSHCGMPWKYVEGKTISYSEHSGMFPVCELCFDSLEPEAIDNHIEKLVEGWLSIDANCGLKWDKEQTPEEVMEVAKSEMRRMKSAIKT